MSAKDPPQFLQLLAHELRWQVVELLAQSDYRVHELVEHTGRSMNLVSYHLAKLRASGLLHERRSSADGRDVYYSLDLDRTRLLFQSTEQQLHPFLGRESAPNWTDTKDAGAAVRVLFLCTHNSARSQMAEGFLRYFGGKNVQVSSAGDHPRSVHPYAVKAMAEQGIDIRGQSAKHKDIFDGHSFDYVVTVCDSARESCPVFVNDPEYIHWSIQDPVILSVHADLDAVIKAEASVPVADDYQVFVEVAQTLRARISHLLARISSERHGQQEYAPNASDHVDGALP